MALFLHLHPRSMDLPHHVTSCHSRFSFPYRGETKTDGHVGKVKRAQKLDTVESSISQLSPPRPRDMEYVNSYTPPQVDTSPVTLPDPNQPYDLNFCFPVKMLETDRVKVVPFLPHVHAKAVYEAITKYPQVMHFMPWPEFATQRAFEEHVEIKGRREPSFCLFVTLNKEGLTKEDEEDPDKISNFLLGTIAYCNASRPLATVEVGFTIVLPPYQRTHVSSHAIGLMMQYALNLPKDGGLGVRRCQWQAHASNQASVRAGMRLGFKMEGVIRWQRPLPEGKESSAPFRTDDSLGLPGRHSAVLAVCWDDWEDGGREPVKRLMERK